ncbi:ArsR family transcriptional regulator [Blautia sp. TM10-2]|jgi:DNA-binding CsgD family transcriptional regulator|uniref:helix-turn-helix transcriptional regulator n=1 Tax=Blautia sp. TM10-2 TaxID=2292990 RepID=UPI000E50C7CA|nr:helix-turn-helix domain-containing protein [Blautia sp. TM10-2]RHU19206.1 ArsR family transcriptional regulator [Blautia sp. TM10-2]
MSSIADEILSYFGISDREDDYLEHYGTPRHSGRYPYGSGENPYQHSGDFLGRISELKKAGFTYTDDDGKVWTGDNAIAKSMGLTSTEYRRQVSWAGYERRLDQVQRAKSLKADGLGATEIGKQMGLSESTVRSLLNPSSEDRMNQAMNTVNFLREKLNEKGMLDVTSGVETSLGISKERLNLALDYLEKAEGCPVYTGGIPQVNTKGQQTIQKVLCKPGTEHKEIYDYSRVKTIEDYESQNDGETFHKKFTYPTSLDSKRLMVRYADDVGSDGFKGVDKDGVIELRRGCQDLSLGDSRYSQVRILVDGTHYLKGMAVYSDDLPDGVDVVFNTNKKRGTPALGDKTSTVLKPIKKDDPDNPFGSAIKDADKGGQYWYTDKKTGKEKLGLINKRADEGDWDEWANAIPSQFLAKQSLSLAKKQLDLAKKDKLAEFDEYMSITNPTIKKHMLEKFADSCDSAAVHLKAAALPGQRYHVIIPINTLKDNEVYAPNYENGTKLALIRYPHGGRFEIPILTVNNKNALARKMLGTDVVDAVGINHKIADQLSGADFDGDTVMCIPTHDPKGKVKILNKPPLKELEGFDPKLDYGGTVKVDADGTEHYYRNGHEYPKMKNTGIQMGVISNLISDMTLAGATDSELARAVKHSMVVIDAEKHKLDYKASEKDNNIAALKKKYQAHIDENGNEVYGGASTILSKAKGQASVDKRQGSYHINIPGSKDYDPSRPDGAKIWKTAEDLYYPDRTYDKKTGIMTVKTTTGKTIQYDVKDAKAYAKYNPVEKRDPATGEVSYTSGDGTIDYRVKKRTQVSTKMAETDDAYTLVSKYRHTMELVYADYANEMKNLGNKARIEMVNTGKIPYSSTAKKTYAVEVKSLMDKLDNSDLNKIKERSAQRKANAEISTKKKAYFEANGEELKGETLRKLSQQALNKYRQEVGSISRRDRNIEITDKEWEAIQAGAISENTLKRILAATDIDKLRQRATPKLVNTLSQAQINRAKAMAASNYTLDDIAKKLGVSPSTISKHLRGVV